MEKSIANLKLILLYTLLILLVSSCASFFLPEGYLPEEKVVYLKQNPLLEPVEYPPITVDTYEWASDPVIDEKAPSILKARDFNVYLKPDFAFDAKIYKEVKSHLNLMKIDESYLELKDMLEAHEFTQPEALEYSIGEKLEDYTNAADYSYPPAKDAVITVFNTGAYKITFPDGRIYTHQKDGSYFEKDSEDTEQYAVFPDKDSYRYRTGEVVWSKHPENIRVEDPRGYVERFLDEYPQFDYSPKGSRFEYVFFTQGESDTLIELALVHENKLRFDYYIEEDMVSVGWRGENVSISRDGRKTHYRFNEKTRKAEEIYSVFFPEGIRIADVHKQRTYSVLAPAWPENYVSRKIGQFVFYYVKSQESYLSRLDAKKLSQVADTVRRKTGIQFFPDRPVILPPDLESFARLHATGKGETLLWYPSGFERTDLIVMWPPSARRYKSDEGNDYFFKTEIYDILVHELTHLAVGEITGVLSPVPAWLNEGLALYSESEWSAETKKYWDITFRVAFFQRKLLDWDEITSNGTGEYPVAKARVHYAQSYAMTSFLIRKYGTDKVIAFTKGFKIPAEESAREKSLTNYKESFVKIFGIDWEKNLAEFKKSVEEKKN